MKTLVQTLTEETKALKADYLAKTAVWASQEFERIKTLASDYRNSRITKESDYWKAQKYLYRIGYGIIRKGEEAFVNKNVSEATSHYESSITKLAERVEAKGLNLEAIKVLSGYVGVNFETTLTDGTKKVRAFTIVASGSIQKPHYRYLVK